MYEVVKRVNETAIWKMAGTSGHYVVMLDHNRFLTFRTIKAAAKYIEENL